MFASTQLAEKLSGYLGRSGGIAYVISPYIEVSALKECLQSRVESEVVVVTSWRSDLLIEGVSSLELFPVCEEKGWTLLANDYLHAKLYSHSLGSAWVGSANMTRSGLGLPGAARPNIEVLQYVEPLSQAARVWVHGLVSGSRLVTKEWYGALVEWLERQPKAKPLPAEDRPDPPRSFDSFLVSQLPATESPSVLWQVITTDSGAVALEDLTAAEHDLGIYAAPALSGEREDFLAAVAESFFAHPFIGALEARIGPDGARFGAVKEWIQETCSNVPVPYRRELTESTQNLYRWFCELAPDRFEVIRPRHTEILRRRAEKSD